MKIFGRPGKSIAFTPQVVLPTSKIAVTINLRPPVLRVPDRPPRYLFLLRLQPADQQFTEEYSTGSPRYIA